VGGPKGRIRVADLRREDDSDQRRERLIKVTELARREPKGVEGVQLPV